MKKKWALLLILVLLAVVGVKIYSDMLHTVHSVIIEEPDLEATKDGVWQGEAKVGPVHGIAEVTLKAHRITGIRLLEHSNMLGGRAEVLTEKILAEQRVDVDTVSGATASSKAILKAVETAIKQGQ